MCSSPERHPRNSPIWNLAREILLSWILLSRQLVLLAFCSHATHMLIGRMSGEAEFHLRLSLRRLSGEGKIGRQFLRGLR